MGVVRPDRIARYGSYPAASNLFNRFFAVWTIRSMNPLLFGYSGELVM